MSLFWDSLKRAFRLDIAWTCYLWGTVPDYSKNLLGHLHKRRGLFWELAKHVVKMLRSFRNRFLVRVKPRNPPEVLFFIGSINHFRAVKPVRERTVNGALWVDTRVDGDCFFPGDLARFVGLLFLPYVYYQGWRRSPRIQRWTIPYSLSGYLDAYGYFVAGLMSLQRLRPKALVLSNDHGPQTRALLAAAHELGIATFYIQHAPVTADFPPLEFQYALLDGADAQRKYRVKNPQCQIHLVGMARRTSTSHLIAAKRFRTNANRLGVALNDFNSMESLETLLQEIRLELPEIEIHIRPHPANWMGFKAFRALAHKYRAHYSDPSTESSWEFLQKLDFIIGGNSGILLEAAFSGVIPLQHASLAKGLDHYGYQRAGVVRPIQSAAEIRELKQSASQVLEELLLVLREFDATFGTDRDGQAAEIAAEVVNRAVYPQGPHSHSMAVN